MITSASKPYFEQPGVPRDEQTVRDQAVTP
jgi:hypothetical protein